MDRRLVALYDLDNPGGPDHDYYRALADSVDARTIADLGCGTGLLTVSFARPGVRVIGVDPDAEMLTYAQHRPGGDRVEWVLGDSQALGRLSADLVVMSGNVAQVITGATWPTALVDIVAALRPGGTLAFESRNPEARAWTNWTRERSWGARKTDTGRLTEWVDVTGEADGEVTFEAHNVFEGTGEHLVYTQALAFRSAEQLAADLERSGLAVSHVWGGWQHQPVTAESPVLVFEAVRSGASSRR